MPPSERTCVVCGRWAHARGLCRRHYAEAAANGTMPPSLRGRAIIRPKRPRPKYCARLLTEGCRNTPQQKGLCHRHWLIAYGRPCATGCGRLAAKALCARCLVYRARHGRLPPAKSLRRKWGGHCAVADCGQAVVARGLCHVHYRRRLRPGARVLAPVLPPGKWLRPPTPETCTVAGCARPYRAKGMCTTHYAAKMRGEDLATFVPRSPRRKE